MRYGFFLFILVAVACNEPVYREVEHTKLKEYVTIDTYEYKFPELLLTFLTDSNELIFNEDQVLNLLKDSIVYLRERGRWVIDESIDTNSLKVTHKIKYFPQEGEPICSFRNYFQILENINDDVLVESEILTNRDSLPFLIKDYFFDPTMNVKDEWHHKTTSIPGYGRMDIVDTHFSLYLDFSVDRNKALSQLKYWFSYLNRIINQLRKEKAQVKFQKSFNKLSKKKKLFILKHIPFKLTIDKPIPPPPPPTFVISSH